MAGDTLIKARKFVISTGSQPLIPKINGLKNIEYYTNENIFDLKELPKNLIIIGGGPIGMEMAQAYSRLGANVTVLEAKNILEKDDPEAVSIAIMQLKSDGVQIKENSLVINIEKDSDSIKVITSDGSIYNGSHLLIAAGRKSNIKYLDLDKANVHHLDQNIKVDSYLKTSNKRIYAIGDVTAKWQFTHSAEYQASIIIKSAIFGLKIKQKTHHIPWTTYLDPEIAQVGLTEAQAHKEYGNKVSIVKVNYRDNDRAIAELEPIGFVKVMVFKGRPVGATIVGKQAGELIQIWCLALSNKLKMTAISSMISPYPTLGELNKRVANAYLAHIVLNNILIKWIVRFFKKF
jgi:pyruvate/2-oxoglutarate dehydrogenase complex dihydrolipoamide dehydrogenase (E3) component